MKNDFQYKEKSVLTSLTGTSLNPIMTRRNSIQLKEKTKKNLSENSFERHLLSGVRKTQTSSREKNLSLRYETLTVGQEFKKRQSKKSKSFSNNIYFPHKNFAQINETDQQNTFKDIIRLKNKSEGGRKKLHASLNNIPKDNHDQKCNIIIHRSQTEAKQEVSFLTKLNIEKRNKIMEIYRPVPKEFAKLRKVKAQYVERLDSLKEEKKSFQGQQNNMRQKKMFVIQEKQTIEIPVSSDSKPKSQQKIEESQFRPSLITHLIIDHPIKKSMKALALQEKRIKSQNHKKLSTQTYQNTFLTSSEQTSVKETDQKLQPNSHRSQPKTQQQRAKELPVQKFTIPKYTDFYDNYVASAELSPQYAQEYQRNQKKPVKSEQISKEVQKLISSCYTPRISGLKIQSITPQSIEESFPNSTKEDNEMNCSTNEDSLNTCKLQNLKKQLLLSNRHTPKLKFLNKFLTEESNFIRQNYKIIKINQGTYIGQIEGNNLPHGIGVIFYKTAKLFEGYFARGLKEGEGLQIYPDGSFFLGNYLNNKKNGKGRFEWSNGQIYDGEWLNDRKHGSGQWKADGAISYVGEWKSNRIEGFGVLIEGQQRYEGQFVNFAKNGHGTYRYQNGQVYTGGFRNNRLNGQGEYYWPNFDHYKGDFLNNKRHGKGALYLATEDILYRGEFRNDKKCGFGQETYRQKVQYVGNFENDLKHGWGILKKVAANEQDTDEIIYQGYWINNQTIQMNSTPEENFGMIEQDEAEYQKNEASKLNVKKMMPKRRRDPQKPKTSPNKSKSQSRKVYPCLDMKPKQSIGLKGRSRYMRIKTNYIQKSIQGSKANLHEKSLQRLQRSRSRDRGVLKRESSNQSLSRHQRECLCEHHK